MWMHLLLLSSLSGAVLDEKGTPIEGAVVVLIPVRFRDEPVTGTSDAMGRFEVALESPGRSASKSAPGYVPFRALDVEVGKPLSIVLRRGGDTIAGVVRDGETLEPLQGAVVETRIGVAGSRVSTAPRLGRVEAVSNERGEFRLEGLERGTYSVSASAPGYGRTAASNVSPGEPVELYLFPGSGVYGRVLDEKGNPVEGALVSTESEDRMRRSPSRPGERSDADGRFAFLGLEPGRYRLFAGHDEFAPAVHDLELARESDAEVEIVLTKGVTLSGRLIDENDEPVKGKLSLRALDGGAVPTFLKSRLTVETDAKGAFSLSSLPAGSHTLVAEARGYGASTVEAVVSGRSDVEDVGDIVLETGLSVSGRVVDEGGNPVPSANVHAYPSQERVAISATDEFFETEADAEGRFVLAGLSEGVYNLNAGAPGFGFSKSQVATTGASNVVIALKGAGSIRGTAIDPEGRPVARLRAVARSPEPRASGTLSQGDDGVFLIENVSEGEYAVEILAPEFLPEAISSVRVTAGNVSDLGTIRLRRGGQVEGTVVNGSDEAVPGATVRAILPGRRMYDSVDRDVATDRSGRFRISGIPDGEVDVVATHPLYAETRAEEVEIDSASGPAEVKIVLRRGGSLDGYVRSRDGSEISGRTIQVMSHEARLDPFGEGLTRTSDDGFFRFEKLPPGTLTVALVQVEPTSMYAIQSREIEIREEETTYVEFLSRRVLVQGQVRRGGAPLAGVALELNSTGSGMRATFGFSDQGVAASSGPWYLTAVTTEDGYYELLVDEPGEYRLSAAANGVALPMTVTIPDADSHS
jgi:protocatechuate 3,4-dioxygenase beta subunit